MDGSLHKDSGSVSEVSATSMADLLQSIDSPADLRALSVKQLPQVSAEIRRFLIHALSENPGHFASSMGAVDIAVALHYVFDTPYDRIVWDVGHQAYAHKILTGRRELFSTNRCLGGLSGFPSPDESEYDTFTAGHASNSISAALGMAVATQLSGDEPRRQVVAVIGDASISGGLAFEGLNNAANTPNNLLIILNDNDMSIDHNVGSLHSYLTHINTSKKYNDLRYRAYQFLRKLGVVNDNRRGLILRFNNALKSLLVGEQNIFEGLNIRYFGPFDGHDVVKIVQVLNQIKDLEGPKILHLRTVKGKGYAPAEDDPAHWHAPGRFDVASGARKGGGDMLKYQDVFGRTLTRMAREDKRIVAVTAAMPSGTSISHMQGVFPDRVFDVGISEGHAVTFAGGLAKEGLRPVVGIYSAFLQRGYDHIVNDVAVQRLPVVFAIDRGGLVGEDGATHHGALDLAYMRTVPGMIVSAPRNGDMLRRLMAAALQQSDGPMSIRYPRGGAVQIDVETLPQPWPIGQGEMLRTPTAPQAVVVGIGTVVNNAMQAADMLAGEGLEVAVADAIFLKPLDKALLQKVAAMGCPVITVEDGTINGGLGSAVAEYLARAGSSLPVTRLGIPDKFVAHGTVAQQQAICGFDADGIAKAVRDAVTMFNQSNTAQ